jgi:hypothetical protein
VAQNNNIAIAPMQTTPFTWQTNTLVDGEDIFSSQQRFDEEFQKYYNLKSPVLSAIAAESAIVLQQALQITNEFEYDSLSKTLLETNFHTFLSALREAR